MFKNVQKTVRRETVFYKAYSTTSSSFCEFVEFDGFVLNKYTAIVLFYIVNT